MCQGMWGVGVGDMSEGSLWESILPFYHVGLRDQKQIVSLSWSCPAGPGIMVLLLF